MRRNNIDLYWAKIDTASEGAIAQVRVTDDGSGSDFLLPFPCKLTKEGWVNAVSGSRLAVRPIYWKPYVATTSKAPMGERRRKSGLRFDDKTAFRRYVVGTKSRERTVRVAVKPDAPL